MTLARATGCCAATRRRRRGPLATTARRCAIPVLGAAVAKVLVDDTALLGIGQRAAPFLAVGGILLVRAYRSTRLLAAGGLSGSGR